MTKEELHKYIVTAFEDVPYPGDGNLGITGGDYDAELVTNTLRGKSWQSLQSSELRMSSLSSMTPQAFHYYLPAYLLVAIEEDDGDPGNELIRKVTPLELDELNINNNFQILFRNFSDFQKNSIVYFLELIYQEIKNWSVEVNEMDESTEVFWELLISYWKRFSTLRT